MRIQIRKGVFETNSSSTHSICISKTPVEINTNRIVAFYLKDYGWSEDEEYDVHNYLYTAIMTFDDRDELLAKLKSILDKNGIKYTMQEPKFHCFSNDGKTYSYLDNGGIDHSDGTRAFIDTVLNDENLFMRMLFGDSVVYTGNDNEDVDLARKDVADATYWSYEAKAVIPNPHHDEENYDYFYKGN
ncbi:hypothetical protein J6A31_05755 [bacterium]|nr:hypothetical protein [bacterium]